jgi:hypothetical protein
MAPKTDVQLELVNMTLFGNGGFADIIKLRI